MKERYGLASDRLVKAKIATITGYEISGIPETVEQAIMLFNKDPFMFQSWAVILADGYESNKKTGDGGVDGWLWFYANANTTKEMKTMIISVKGGKNVSVEDVRALIGVMNGTKGKKYDMGALVCLQATEGKLKFMRAEASTQGLYKDDSGAYDRVQIITIDELLNQTNWLKAPGKIPYKKRTKQGILV